MAEPLICSCCKKEIHPEDVRYFEPANFQDCPFCLPCFCSIGKKAEDLLAAKA